MQLLENGRQLFLSQDLAVRIGIVLALFLQHLYYRLQTQDVVKDGTFGTGKLIKGEQSNAHLWMQKTISDCIADISLLQYDFFLFTRKLEKLSSTLQLRNIDDNILSFF
ncbi:hypothetical protein [Solibacillus sp. FSL W8-0372]|uniref:hypothetical protein n=1 Tax=Solibacillus sp. FSL W8-0372 TaxID=2921713 RepID=UPI0030D0C61B